MFDLADRAYMQDIKLAARQAVSRAARTPERYGLPARSAWTDLPMTDLYDGLRDAAYVLLDSYEYYDVLDLDDDLLDVTEWAVTLVHSPQSFR